MVSNRGRGWGKIHQFLLALEGVYRTCQTHFSRARASPCIEWVFVVFLLAQDAWVRVVVIIIEPSSMEKLYPRTVEGGQPHGLYTF